MSKYTVTLENNYGDTLYPETKATVVSTDSGSTVEAVITDLQNRVVNSATPILGTCIELTRGTPYIDFHFGSETESDFTSRIIESEEGVLHLGATPPSESNNTAIATTAYVQAALSESIPEYTAGEGIEISDYEVAVSGYSDIVSGIAELSESVSELESSVASIESTIGSLTSEELDELTAAVQEIQDTISILDDLSESVTSLDTDITDLQNRVVNFASPVQTALVDIKNAIPYLRFYYGSGDSVTSYIREGTSGLLNINATPDTSDNSTSIATTAFVRNAIAEYVLDEIYPVGSTYVQLPGTSTPATLFGGTWENISANFNGTFLRVADDTDGLAGTFGTSQASGAPDIFGQVIGTGGNITISTSASTIGGSGAFTPSVVSETAYYSSSYSSGTRTGNNVVTFYASTYDSTYGNASEVRPHAHSVRVWQRTA